MSFENPQLAVEHLPAYQDSHYQQLEPAYKKVIYGVTIFFVLIVMALPILAYFGIEDTDEMRSFGIYGSLGFWIFTSLISLIVVGPAFRQKGYAIRDKDISYKTGLINRTTTTIPFNRVQHCDIKQGLISRYFGLSKLNVYTAGGAKSDLSIPGLKTETAEQLMNFVLQKTLASDEEE